ncbi:MAG: phosphoglycerate mutase family protein [Flavobacteriaceae bacterium]
MTKIIALISFCIIAFSCKQEGKKSIAEETTTYYLIRHAEKDRSDSTNVDPALTEKGLDRARLWAHYFDSIPLNEIYTTQYKRTHQTAMYVATKQQLPAEEYVPQNLITEDFKQITKGHKVLIVGHSNTTPMLVNQLIGNETYPEMDDRDNSSLYVVTVKGKNTKAVIRKVEFQ